jgi:CO/xanthine dehydrogenase Mo-binding subunit
MACGFHTSGAGSEQPASYISDYSGATVKMNEDGTANLILAAADFGSGNLTAIATMVAEELGILYEDVIVSRTDTDTSMYEFWIHASRSVYSTGEAGRQAAEKTKNIFLEWASQMLKIPVKDLTSGNRKIYKKSDPAGAVPIREVLEWAQSLNMGTAIGSASYRATACPPHFVVTFLVVDVDTLTGEVKIVKAVHGADVGTPINPEAVRGQLCGGLHMGLGFALTENVVYDADDGHVLNPGFTDYRLLTPVDMPEIETFLVESTEPTGPFGAKGVGEGSANPVAPAVYNAVSAAIGARVFTMPLTPEKVLAAIEENTKKTAEND